MREMRRGLSTRNAGVGTVHWPSCFPLAYPSWDALWASWHTLGLGRPSPVHPWVSLLCVSPRSVFIIC